MRQARRAVTAGIQHVYSVNVVTIESLPRGGASSASGVLHVSELEE